MTRDWTDNQQAAIGADGRDICVAAGAGSGKTGVLVERFVRLIVQSKRGELPPEQRANVDNILVITFTEKATKEMKKRIVQKLNDLKLVEERRQIETAYISTIHGFCSRLLQENPFEAGVDPQFTVLDEPQARRLLRQEFENIIARAYAEGDTEIIELVAAAHASRQPGAGLGDPLSGLASAIASVMAKMGGAGRSRQEVERHWQRGRDATANQALEPVWTLLTPLLEEITACTEGLQSLRSGIMGALDVAMRAVLESAPALQPRAASLPDTLAAMECVLKIVGRVRPRVSGVSPQEMAASQLFMRIKIACEEARDLFNVVAAREEEAAKQCHRFWGLLAAVWEAYDLAKQRQGKLDTDDLQAEGVRLLEESPSVRDRFRRRFRYLMVDEFQDTNPLQMRLIELLRVPEGGKQSSFLLPNYLFVVGDVQQSIYGFRHAEPGLFRALERQFREGDAGLHVPLAVNFRSRPEILSVIARIFGQVWREETTPFVPLSPGEKFEDKAGPSLEILLSQDLYRRDYVRLEADALVGRVQQMVEGQELRLTARSDTRCGEPIAYRDIAVLLRSLTDIEKYEQAFARRGVPYFVVGGGRGYYVRHEIRDLLNVLTVLDTPLDDVALAAVLRSPFVGADVDTLYRLAQQARQISVEKQNHIRRYGQTPLYFALEPLISSGQLPAEEAEKLTKFVEVMDILRVQEDRLPVGHLLERLIVQTHYDARLLCRSGGRRRLANVRKLLQMANGDSVMGVREFIRRLRDLEKLSDREGDAPTEEEAADVVRLLTIHGAKGLEFPVVALADLSRPLLIPERGLFACDPRTFALGTKLNGEPNVVYKAMDRKRQQEDKKESERLLYVAMTRAREHLILCGNVGRNRGVNWADSLFPLLGVLEAPPQPEVGQIGGGVAAKLAPLSYYAQSAGVPPSETSPLRPRDTLPDQIAASILNGDDLKTFLH